MKLYQSHKQVKAAQIDEVNPINCRFRIGDEWQGFGPVWWAKHADALKGGAYFVEYEDGYVSVSPKEAFEGGYSEVEDSPSLKAGNLYRKKNVQQLDPWTESVDMDSVSISEEDKNNGSPKEGDMIAVNANNPEDRWLVSEKFFKENYVPA